MPSLGFELKKIVWHEWQRIQYMWLSESSYLNPYYEKRQIYVTQ